MLIIDQFQSNIVWFQQDARIFEEVFEPEQSLFKKEAGAQDHCPTHRPNSPS